VVDNPQILSVRLAAGLASAWSEYLCMTKQNDGVTLDVRQYEVLAEVEKFENADGELKLPDIIDGKAVIGAEDGFIVGGELQRCGDWELAYAHANLENTLAVLRQQFDLDSEAVVALMKAVSLDAAPDDEECEVELFAWRKGRLRQRGSA
jgi:hypothetical protein